MNPHRRAPQSENIQERSAPDQEKPRNFASDLRPGSMGNMRGHRSRVPFTLVHSFRQPLEPFPYRLPLQGPPVFLDKDMEFATRNDNRAPLGLAGPTILLDLPERTL
jgi:hypothetical protein